jgi:signal transduction histidine kinase
MSSEKSEKADFSLILASSVHDMKNSLGMLLHSLEELCEKFPEDSEHNLGVSTIRYEAERVNNDLIQLLGVYRLQKRMLAAHLDEHFLDDIFAEQQAQYRQVFSVRGIHLAEEIGETTSWFFDRELVSGILNNALNNASRYTKSQIIITGKETQLEGHPFLEISVHDDGNGYPDNILRLDPSDIQNNLNFKTGSTSLGLYFASQVAALHQQNDKSGFIKLENGGKLGGGVFRLYLP